MTRVKKSVITRWPPLLVLKQFLRTLPVATHNWQSDLWSNFAFGAAIRYIFSLLLFLSIIYCIKVKRFIFINNKEAISYIKCSIFFWKWNSNLLTTNNSKQSRDFITIEISSRACWDLQKEKAVLASTCLRKIRNELEIEVGREKNKVMKWFHFIEWNLSGGKHCEELHVYLQYRKVGTILHFRRVSRHFKCFRPLREQQASRVLSTLCSSKEPCVWMAVLQLYDINGENFKLLPFTTFPPFISTSFSKETFLAINELTIFF